MLWPIKEFSDNPNTTTPVVTNPHLNSIIYAENTSSDPNDFPVKGYIVGGTTSIWSYSDCRASDFGWAEPSYIQMFSSPNSVERVGYVTRIENLADSCERKQVGAVTNVKFIPGTGRNDSMTDKLTLIFLS